MLAGADGLNDAQKQHEIRIARSSLIIYAALRARRATGAPDCSARAVSGSCGAQRRKGFPASASAQSPPPAPAAAADEVAPASTESCGAGQTLTERTHAEHSPVILKTVHEVGQVREVMPEAPQSTDIDSMNTHYAVVASVTICRPPPKDDERC